MKKLLTIFAQFNSPQQEVESKPKEHYLQYRMKRLQRLAQLSREDKNACKVIQAHRLINQLQVYLSNQTKINLPYIKEKQSIN
jgi:hypothetical protein